METKARVIIIGFDPDVVDLSQWPDLTPEKIRGMLESEKAGLKELGYEADLCFTDLGATAASTVTAALKANSYDCVLIGAGVRTAAEHFMLFESLVNTVHEHAPKAKFCFNSNPTDTAAAIQRWA